MSREIVVKNMNGNIKAYNTSFSYENSSFKGAVFEIKFPIE